MTFKKEGSIAWYIGAMFCVVGFMFMFTKEELSETKAIMTFMVERFGRE